MNRWAAAVIGLLLVLAACSINPAINPAITRDQAIAIASGQVPGAQLVSAEYVSPTGEWVVEFSGSWGAPCPAPATGDMTDNPNCAPFHTAIVELDGQTGQFLTSTYR